MNGLPDLLYNNLKVNVLLSIILTPYNLKAMITGSNNITLSNVVLRVLGRSHYKCDRERDIPTATAEVNYLSVILLII